MENTTKFWVNNKTLIRAICKTKDLSRINSDTWLDELNQFKTKGHTAVGTVQQLKDFCKSVSKKWRTGIQLNPALE